eukprot:SAG11_NODE_2848_length_2909_cov_10.989324_2_plen_86_part_00
MTRDLLVATMLPASEKIVSELDINKDGQVTKDEFKKKVLSPIHLEGSYERRVHNTSTLSKYISAPSLILVTAAAVAYVIMVAASL